MRFALIALLTLVSCTEFPELGGTITPNQSNAPFPTLVPLDHILAQSANTTTAGPTAEADLTPRLANLRARASRLRGPVIPSAQRARMLSGIR